MQLTTRGRYAVMSMVDLASHEIIKPVPLSDIALRQDISLNYLEQLFKGLRLHGLVQGTRGLKGGYQLARPASNISIADIMIAVDESFETTRCNYSQHGCLKGKKCSTHDLWASLGQHIMNFLRATSLQDVLISQNLKNEPLFEPSQSMQNLCGHS